MPSPERRTIRTERCLLIPLSRPLIEARLQDSDFLWRHTEGAADVTFLVPPDWPGRELQELFNVLLLGMIRPDAVVEDSYAIGWLDGALLVGACGTTSPLIDGDIEIGYGVSASQTSQGFATEAVDALISDLFRRPGVQRVLATAEPDNQRSQRVLRRLGFQQVGITSDPQGPLLRFALTRSRKHPRGTVDA